MLSSDRKVIQCNYAEATSIAAAGARAYVVRGNPGYANDRFVIVVRSRGGQWVEKWENATRLTNFRVKVLPPDHPLHHRNLMPAENAPTELAGITVRS